MQKGVSDGQRGEEAKSYERRRNKRKQRRIVGGGKEVMREVWSRQFRGGGHMEPPAGAPLRCRNTPRG